MNYGGVIRNSLFESSYKGDESYDYISVLSAGGVSSCQYDTGDEPEESVLDILEDICDLLEELTEDVEDIAHLMRYKQDWDESFIASIYLD